MLSLSKGQPIAQVTFKDAKKKPTTIYINDDDEPSKNDEILTSANKDDVLPKSFYTGLKNVNAANMLLLKRAIRLNKKELLGNNQNLCNAFERANELLDELQRKYLEIPKSIGKVELSITDNWNGHISVFGSSGSGKSYWIGKYLQAYKKKFPKNNIYIFSPILNDPAFSEAKPQYVKIDDGIVENPLDIKESEFKNSVMVFDDIESLNKPYKQLIEVFRDQVLECGRHYNQTAICVSHIILNGQSTRRILNESSKIVVFPKSNFNAISNLARRYFGMSRDEINYIRTTSSRWVCICRNYPNSIISENAIKIL